MAGKSAIIGGALGAAALAVVEGITGAVSDRVFDHFDPDPDPVSVPAQALGTGKNRLPQPPADNSQFVMLSAAGDTEYSLQIAREIRSNILREVGGGIGKDMRLGYRLSNLRQDGASRRSANLDLAFSNGPSHKVVCPIGRVTFHSNSYLAGKVASEIGAVIAVNTDGESNRGFECG